MEHFSSAKLPFSVVQVYSRSTLHTPGKESFAILSTHDPCGDPFRLLGVLFDSKLNMGLAVRECVCVSEGSWRLRTLIRTRMFFNDGEMLLFTSHMCFLASSTGQQLCTMPAQVFFHRWIASSNLSCAASELVTRMPRCISTCFRCIFDGTSRC